MNIHFLSLIHFYTFLQLDQPSHFLNMVLCRVQGSRESHLQQQPGPSSILEPGYVYIVFS